MNDERERFLEEYRPVLDEYLGGGGEASLMRAYDLGRQALSRRWDFLDVTTIHQSAILLLALGAMREGEAREMAGKAREFLNQVLVPFEMVQRGFVEANKNLREANELLEQMVNERTQQLEEGLQREILLRKEIHHRVKNNLQVISAMLFLQSRQVKDPQVVELFAESQNRVKSIALIHEKLYQSSGLTRIPMAGYVADLCSSLIQSQRAPGREVVLRTQAEGISLGIDLAVPCALLINELVSNALKHAFPAGRPGEVQVELQRAAGNLIVLTVADNGVGLPDDVDARQTRSLGLQLVGDLARQLGGQLAFERATGTTCRISFPDATAEHERRM